MARRYRTVWALVLAVWFLTAAAGQAQDPADALQAACSEGDASACVRLADLRDGADVGSARQLTASYFYAQACDLAVPELRSCRPDLTRACSTAFERFSDAGGAVHDSDRASELERRLCDCGDYEACARAGRRLLTSQAEPGLGEQLWRRACVAGDVSNCADLGAALSELSGDSGEVRPGQRRALGAFARACDAGDAQACAAGAAAARAAQAPESAAWFDGVLCESEDLGACVRSDAAEGLDIVASRPASVLERAEVEDLAYRCFEHADAAACGYGASKWPGFEWAPTPLNLEMAQRGCALENARSCMILGAQTLHEGGADAQGVARLQDGCALDPEVCGFGMTFAAFALIGAGREEAVASLLQPLTQELCAEGHSGFCETADGDADGDGSDIADDAAQIAPPPPPPPATTGPTVQSEAALVRACERGELSSCEQAAVSLMRSTRTPEEQLAGARYADQYCSADSINQSDPICEFVPFMLLRLGDSEDERRAAALLERRCDLEEVEACELLAHAYFQEDQLGGPDFAAAARWFDRACALGATDSCSVAARAYAFASRATEDAELRLRYARRGADLCDAPGDAAEPQTCAVLAQYLFQAGEEAEKRRAARLMTAMCERENPFACAASLYRVSAELSYFDVDPQIAFRVLAPACGDTGPDPDDYFCEAAKAARRRLPDLRLAVELCNAGDVGACWLFVTEPSGRTDRREAVLETVDHELAASLLGEVCRADDETRPSCRSIGVLSEGLSNETLARLCTVNAVRQGCWSLARRYLEGSASRGDVSPHLEQILTTLPNSRFSYAELTRLVDDLAEPAMHARLTAQVHYQVCIDRSDPPPTPAPCMAALDGFTELSMRRSAEALRAARAGCRLHERRACVQRDAILMERAALRITGEESRFSDTQRFVTCQRRGLGCLELFSDNNARRVPGQGPFGDWPLLQTCIATKTMPDSIELAAANLDRAGEAEFAAFLRDALPECRANARGG